MAPGKRMLGVAVGSRLLGVAESRMLVGRSRLLESVVSERRCMTFQSEQGDVKRTNKSYSTEWVVVKPFEAKPHVCLACFRRRV